ncbi:hypothetical protein NE237_013318 [Protea cynaroides]|uniref:Ubiquitin-related modifier 1 homolog n=1 Tax=Protea cynaroides TaxID=273540 RepID=A0A9Q0GZP4_9MAGN|nr:hypothetical protein NE237_013318 [Protea cynaroides]
MQLTIEFGGGLELLCQSIKIHNVDVDMPAKEKKLTMKNLLSWVHTNLIKERPEMFMKGDTVRPGVLVLINDCDWELSGQLDTTLEEKDVLQNTWMLELVAGFCLCQSSEIGSALLTLRRLTPSDLLHPSALPWPPVS